MCSRSGEVLLVTEPKRAVGTDCIKCGAKDCTITRGGEPFCNSCFGVFVTHKFRSTIGKSKLVRDGERVLVAFSGGSHSRSLLQLIVEGLSESTHKKLRFTPVFIHIDESVIGVSSSVTDVVEEMESSHYPACITALELALLAVGKEFDSSCDAGKVPTNDCLDPNKPCSEQKPHPASAQAPLHSTSLPRSPLYWTSTEHNHRSKSEVLNALSGRLNNVLAGLDCQSARDDFVHQLRFHQLASIARQLNIHKVLTADCTTRLASRILTDIAQGRGTQVAANANFCDDRMGDVLFLKPLKDLQTVELETYLSIRNSPEENKSNSNITDSTQPCEDKGEEPLSMFGQSESFLIGLQGGFTTTCNNIVRTSSKLQVPGKNDIGQEKCSFCRCMLATTTGGLNVPLAVEMSQDLSNKGCQDGEERPSSALTDEAATSTHHKQSLLKALAGLCYGCKLMFKNYNGDIELLSRILTGKEDDFIRESMKKELGEIDARLQDIGVS